MTKVSGSISAQLAEINNSISGLTESINMLGSRMDEAEERISTAEDMLEGMETVLLKLHKDNEYLMDKVHHLENYSRRCNIWIIGFREGF